MAGMTGKLHLSIPFARQKCNTEIIGSTTEKVTEVTVPDQTAGADRASVVITNYRLSARLFDLIAQALEAADKGEEVFLVYTPGDGDDEEYGFWVEASRHFPGHIALAYGHSAYEDVLLQAIAGGEHFGYAEWLRHKQSADLLLTNPLQPGQTLVMIQATAEAPSG